MPAGRPRIEIDPRQVESMAEIGCNNREIALILDIGIDTLWRNFKNELDKGREQGKRNLRMLMWDSAKKGSVAMQIFLAKNWLKYRDADPSDAAAVEDGANRIVESLQGKSHSELLEQYMQIRNEAREVKELVVNVDDEEKDSASKE